jgi:Icc-related predicted phosphoesterase
LISSNDIFVVFSHRGTKTFSIQSLDIAKKFRATTVLVTGPFLIYKFLVQRKEYVHQRKKESIEKETEALLNAQSSNYQEIPPQSSIKIQLWSNNSKTDYAIKLKGKSDFLAATRRGITEQYTDLVEESDYFEDIQYDWNYTIRHWIDNHTSNIISEFKDLASVFTETSNSATRTKGGNSEIYNSPILKEIQNKTYSRKKGIFKCNYCKLIITTKIKRGQHEQEWHTASKPNGL